jgi:protein ImuA
MDAALPPPAAAPASDPRRAALAGLRRLLASGPARTASGGQGGWRLPDVARLCGPDAAGAQEIVAAAAGDFPRASAFALGLVRALREQAAPVVWIQSAGLRREHGRLSASGLRDLGLDPGRILLVAARRPGEALWAAEEAARSGLPAATLCEVETAAFTATRRLALAAREAAAPVFLVFPAGRTGATAAFVRWRVAAAPGAAHAFDPAAPGRLKARAVLEKRRLETGAAGEGWVMEWDDDTHDLRLAGELADRALEAGEDVRRTG